MDVSLAFIVLGPDMVPCAKAGMVSESARALAARVIRSMMVSRCEVGRMLPGRENRPPGALLLKGPARQKVSGRDGDHPATVPRASSPETRMSAEILDKTI